jgi:hypothetical protein
MSRLDVRISSNDLEESELGVGLSCLRMRTLPLSAAQDPTKRGLMRNRCRNHTLRTLLLPDPGRAGLSSFVHDLFKPL